MRGVRRRGCGRGGSLIEGDTRFGRSLRDGRGSVGYVGERRVRRI